MNLQEISKLKGDGFIEAISGLSLNQLRELLMLLGADSKEFKQVEEKINILLSSSNLSKEIDIYLAPEDNSPNKVSANKLKK